jgi:DNA-binding SARP family transcriptional activator/tetratricopeptide (TPR) repeat protein
MVRIDAAAAGDSETRPGGVRFGLLGTLVLADGHSGPVTVSGARQRTLLASLLLSANVPVSLDALAESVWDGSPPDGAATTLRSHVRRLRRALGPRAAARITFCSPGYLISVQEPELDVLSFQAACRKAAVARSGGQWQKASAAATGALELWRGTPLLDVPSQVLRDQVVPALEQLRLQALEDRAEAELRLGSCDLLIPELRGLVARHPVRERFHAQLMEALARAGRQAEALEAYRQARQSLVDELGIEPGPHLQLLHKQILAGDPSLVAPSNGEAVAASRGSGSATSIATAVPRQLPAAPQHFAGRQGEVERLTALAALAAGVDTRAGRVVISAIDGMAGIGKTALAVHVAHRLAEGFPDGQIFLDLHGHSPRRPPYTVSEALGSLLRTLGVPPERIPEDEEQAAALYRQRLADTRTLVVLDNAAHEAQVRPLLPGGGSCLVLVTSRKRLKALDDAELVPLDLLSPADAVALLRAVTGPARIPAGDPLASEVALLCGHLPLALRIAGALLRHRPAWDLNHLAGKLRDENWRVSALSDGDRRLAAVFDLSYASLDAAHQRLWRCLGLVPGADLDAWAAATLVEIDPVLATGLLEDLVDDNLLNSYAPGRYRLHDLLRAYAGTLAAADPAAERDAALHRLLNYYAYTAQKASSPVARYPRRAPGCPAPASAPELADPQTARTWLRSEQSNLEASFAHARTRGLDRAVIALAAGLAEILLSDGPWTRALDICQAAADAAGRVDDPAADADALTDLGRLRQLTGDYPGASSVLTQALAAYRQRRDRLGEANALASLGRVRALTGAYRAAGEALTHALEIYRGIGNRLGEADALTILARLRQVTGDHPGASDALTCALQIYQDLSHPHGQANVLADLGRVRHLTGDYPAAGEALTQALEIYRALGNRLGEANARTDLGRVREVTGDYPGADDALSNALDIYRSLGNRNGEAYALTNLGHVRHRAGDCSGAAEALTRALEIYRALGNRGNTAWALNYYAATLAASGQRPRALELYEQALVMNRELNKPDDEAVSLEGIAEHLLVTGDPAAGIGRLHQALSIYQRLGMVSDAHRVGRWLDSLASR